MTRGVAICSLLFLHAVFFTRRKKNVRYSLSLLLTPRILSAGVRGGKKFNGIKGIHYEGYLDYLKSTYSLATVAQPNIRNFLGMFRCCEIEVIISPVVNTFLNFGNMYTSVEKFCSLNYITTRDCIKLKRSCESRNLTIKVNIRIVRANKKLPYIYSHLWRISM